MSFAETTLPITHISPRMAEAHTSVMNGIRPSDFDHTPGWRIIPSANGLSRSLVMRNDGVENRTVNTELIFSNGIFNHGLSSFYQTGTGERVEAYVAHVNDHNRPFRKNQEETLTAGLTYRPRWENGIAHIELNHEEQLAKATAWSSVVVRLSERGASKLVADLPTAAGVEIVIDNTTEGPSYTLRYKGSQDKTIEINRDDMAARGIKLPTVVFYPTGIVVHFDGTRLQIDTTPVSPHAKMRLQRNVFVATVSASEEGTDLFAKKSE